MMRFARTFGLAAGPTLVVSALVLSALPGAAAAQAPAAAPPPGHGTPQPAPAGGPSAGAASEGKAPITALEAKKAAIARSRQQRANPTVPTPSSPHGARRQGPRIVPATDLPAGEIQVMLTSKDFENIENQEIGRAHV